MSEAEILAAIAEISHHALDWEGEVHREQRLIEDLELDSLKLMTLAMEVEDHFEILLDEKDERSVHTIGDLVDLVRSKLSE